MDPRLTIHPMDSWRLSGKPPSTPRPARRSPRPPRIDTSATIEETLQSYDRPVLHVPHSPPLSDAIAYSSTPPPTWRPPPCVDARPATAPTRRPKQITHAHLSAKALVQTATSVRHPWVNRSRQRPRSPSTAPAAQASELEAGWSWSQGLVKQVKVAAVVQERPLRREAYAWWKVPPHVVSAADRFDTLRRQHKAHAHSALSVLEKHNIAHAHVGHVESDESLKIFNKAHLYLRRQRYVETPVHPQRKAAQAKWRPATPRGIPSQETTTLGWSLEDSIWKGRPGDNDSHSFWDEAKCSQKIKDQLWERALRFNDNRLAKWLMFMDGESDDDDEDAEKEHAGAGHGTKASPFKPGLWPLELKEVGDVIWKHWEMLFSAFDYYAGLTGDMTTVDSITMITMNGFELMLEDCKLAVPHSKSCNYEHLNILFLDANYTTKDSSLLEHGMANHDKMLNRREFLGVLARASILRHVLGGDTPDASEAMDLLCTTVLAPNLPAIAKEDRNAFRATCCYVEPVDRVLCQHEKLLRDIFDEVIKTRDVGKVMHRKGHMSFESWITLLQSLDFFDSGLSKREACYVFVFSRMRSLDFGTKDSRVKMLTIGWWDFLEAIVRLSTVKVLPTEDDIHAAGYTDAGTLLVSLKKEGHEKYDSFIRSLESVPPRDWSDPLPQPIEKLVEHLLSVIQRTIGTSGVQAFFAKYREKAEKAGK